MNGKYYWQIAEQKENQTEIDEKKQNIYNKAEEVYKLVNRAEKISIQIKNIDAMIADISGGLTINAKNHKGFNLNTVAIDIMPEIVLEMAGVILKTELQFIKNDIEQFFDVGLNEKRE